MLGKRIAECDFELPDIKLSSTLIFSTVKYNFNNNCRMCTKEIKNCEHLSFDFQIVQNNRRL